MKYLNPNGFSLPASNGRMSDLEYALAVGAITEDEHKQLKSIKEAKLVRESFQKTAK